MWLDDLERGEAVEREWLSKLLPLFHDAYMTFGKDSRFDIAIPETDTTIEVKFDPRSLETGNIVLEYFHNKPSGISVSEATHWLFVTGEENIWISSEKLKACVLIERIMPTQIQGGDDRHPKAVFLIPAEILKSHANAVGAPV